MKNTLNGKGVMMNAKSECVATTKLVETPAGFAARDRLFSEIQNLRASIYELSAKLDPISYRAPREEKLSCGGGASSEYFQSICEAANMVADLRDTVVAMYQDVEL